MIPCDGCTLPLDPAKVAIVNESGVQCRYCPDCLVEWESFRASCQAQAAAYQRLQEMFEQERRKHIALRITPLDFPRFWTHRTDGGPEQALILG